MKVNENIVELACEGYYNNGLAQWSGLSETMKNRYRAGLDEALFRIFPLIAAGEEIYSDKVIVNALQGMFAVTIGQEEGWDLWVKEYGKDQYNVYAPAVRQALHAVYGT